jgi:DNA-binding IclR family transcriptional regulator
MTPTNTVQSVHRAIELLEDLRRAGESGASLRDLAVRARLKPPTAHNLLKTLVSLEYAAHDPATRRYRLGGRARSLGRPADPVETLARVAGPSLNTLRDRFRETVILTVFRDGMRCTLRTAESTEDLRVGAGCGEDVHLYTTATGRVLLSLIPAADLEAFVAAHGLPGREWPGVRTRRQLAAARDISADAVPVPLPDGGPVAAIGVYYPRSRPPADGPQAVQEAMTDAAARVAAAFHGATA